MMIPFADESSAAGVSLARTSAYTPRSRTFRAIRWQYSPPASRTIICAVGFNFRCYQVAQSGTEQQSRSQMKWQSGRRGKRTQRAHAQLLLRHGPRVRFQILFARLYCQSQTRRLPDNRGLTIRGFDCTLLHIAHTPEGTPVAESCRGAAPAN